MTRSYPKNSSSKSLGRTRRKLCFDILEDRRLLAGIDVFVFDDLNGSGAFDSGKDGAISDRAVYIDLNKDGNFNSSEPWATSDSYGIAKFPNLESGEYSVRLLGSNRSVLQTFPTRPADQGNWSDGLNVSKVLGIDSSGLTWGISGNSISLTNVSSNQTVKSIRFGTSTVIDGLLEPASSEGDFSGYALTRSQDQLQVLWQVSTAGYGTKRAISLDVAAATRLVSVGDHVLVLSGSSSQEIALLDSSNSANTNSLKSIGVSGLSNATIKAAGSNGFLVLEAGETSNRLSFYQLHDGVGQLIGSRSFAAAITSWDVSADGENIAVSTANEFLIVSPLAGLPTKAILDGATGPIVFDPIKNLLLTGSVDNPSKITLWSVTDWVRNLKITIANGRTLTGSNASLHLDALATRLVGSQNGSLYQQSISTAAAAVATVSSSGTSMLKIGVRSIGVNLKPELKKLDAMVVDEDGRVSLDSAQIQLNASDPDGDKILFLVRSGPTRGQVNLNFDGTGFYLPTANANGQDSLTIQAYDGRDWSMVRELPIVINPIYDAPSTLEFSTDSIAENQPLLSALATFQVVGPESDAVYEYSINDSRFSGDGGVLRLVNGSINFEEEPLIVLAVTVFDRFHPGDSISRTLTLQIQDVNDAPTGISSASNFTVPELNDDFVLGRVSVIDQDANEQYTWSVSDRRFEIQGGMLRLAKGESLDFEKEASIALVLRGRDAAGQFEIAKKVTVTVTDQDDQPTGLVLNSTASITESQTDVVIGRVSVLDADVGEVYSFGVDDGRFEVVRGEIRLRPGSTVSYVEPGFLDLTVTATSLRSGIRVSGNLHLNIIKDPTPHHNDANPYDVDGDGFLTPLDPLIIINYINNNGIGPIEEPGEGESALPDLDVDGDGEVTPLDILILINRLNRGDDEDFHSVGDFNKGLARGEGEGSAKGSMPKAAFHAATPIAAQVSSTQVSSGQNDASLASYLADLSEEVGPRKLRRK